MFEWLVTELKQLWPQTINWLNDNEGVLTLSLFLATLLLGWVSGAFTSLRRRPRFRVRLIVGPNFSCTFPTGRKQGEFEAHRTAICLYVQISNVGSEAASISNISVGYHWQLRPFSILWLRKSVFRSWLHHQSVALDDFQTSIGGSIKVYPFLFQRNSLSPASVETYLPVGMAVNGVVYFEEPEAWGGAFPRVRYGKTKVRVALTDTFGRKHYSTHSIPVVTLDEARRYNPRFGETLATLAASPPNLDDPQSTKEVDAEEVSTPDPGQAHGN